MCADCITHRAQERPLDSPGVHDCNWRHNRYWSIPRHRSFTRSGRSSEVRTSNSALYISLFLTGIFSILICYGIVGFIVYVTVSLLGELATQYPVAGSFTVYAARFFSPAYAFALSWNYWFNDAVSVASDLTAAQLVLQFWTDWHPWVISVVFLVFLLGVNALSVRSYGEMGTVASRPGALMVLIFGFRIYSVVPKGVHSYTLRNYRILRQCWI